MDDRTGEVKIIEFNPRFWATTMYSTLMGVNFLAAGIQMIWDDLQLPAFHPVEGRCEYPGPTRRTLVNYLRRGLKPPIEWLGEREHGIDFVVAQRLWIDPDRVEIPAKTEDEPRFLVIGRIDQKCWSAIITYHNNRSQIISIRRSCKEAVEIYEGR